MRNNLIPIESREGVTIYGRMGANRRLGNFEVHSKLFGKGQPYTFLSEAEARMNAILGTKSKQ